MRFFCLSGIIFALLVSAQSQHSFKSDPNGPVYDALGTVIDEAANNIQLYTTDLTQRVNQTFNTFKDKVDDWKNNNAFTKQLEAFQAEGNKCIKENEVALAKFMRNLAKTYDSCSLEVKGFVTENLKAIIDSIKIIENAPLKIKEISKDCISHKQKDLATSVLCVVTDIAEIQQATGEAGIVIEKFIKYGIEEVETFAATKCTGIKDLDKEFVELFNQIKSCIHNNKQ